MGVALVQWYTKKAVVWKPEDYIPFHMKQMYVNLHLRACCLGKATSVLQDYCEVGQRANAWQITLKRTR